MPRIHTALFLLSHPFVAVEAAFFLLQVQRECRHLVPEELANRHFQINSLASMSDKTKCSSCAQMIRLLSRKIIHATCLHQSIALCRMLKRRSVSYTLKLGIDKNEKSNRLAHAWVETSGYIFSWGVSSEKYTELKEIIPSKENLLL